MEVFRPKNFRHLHSVITTSWDPVEGMINLSGMMVNSPEPYAMKAVAKTLSDKTPLVFTYSSEYLAVTWWPLWIQANTFSAEVEGQNPKKSAVLTHGDLLKRADKLAKRFAASLGATCVEVLLFTFLL
jgi:hypothetical protein